MKISGDGVLSGDSVLKAAGRSDSKGLTEHVVLHLLHDDLEYQRLQL
jgi:hypothetical protein